jgi:hypothetical protein
VIQHVSVTAGSSYFEGPCHECPPGERNAGQLVTSLYMYPVANEDSRVPNGALRLCATHTNELIDHLQRAGIRRDI